MGPEQFGMGGWWIFPIIMIIICFTMMFFAFSFSRRGGGPPLMQGGADDRRQRNISRGGNSESPLELLQRRYASGEISKAEYEEMKRDLL
jgi:putative membrane protein